MQTTTDVRRLTTTIVASYLAHHTVKPADVPALISNVADALRSAKPSAPPVPAVPIAKSVRRDCIVCLEDGKKLRTLKRYLRTRYGMTPDEYRHRWNLPADYPMCAPEYSANRSQNAKRIGLGRIGRTAQGRPRCRAA